MNKTINETYLYTPAKKLPDAVKLWMSFPANYNIGMSAMGYLSIFKNFDTSQKANPEKLFTDTEKTLHDIREIKLIGFSFSFEFDFINVFKILEKYQIPLYSQDRNESFPLIFAGGPVMSANPEPFADFFDFIIVGDGENSDEITNLIYDNPHLSKNEILEKLSTLEGIYVPSQYEIKYNEDLTIKSISPDRKIKKITTKSLNCVASPIVTPNTMFANNCFIEIARGCPQKCAFCLASYANLPFRYPPFEQIIEAIDAGIEKAGKVGLLGALVSAHPEFDKITEYILDKLVKEDFEVSISSLRADRINPQIVQMLVKGGQRTSTIALEAGSQRLRDFINKRLTEEQIFDSIRTAKENGLIGLKIYSMIGLPTETMDDIEELCDLMKRLQKEFRDFSLTLSSSSFVPKAHTPFQWYGREDLKSLEKKNEYLKKHLHMAGIKYRPTSVKWDNIQGLIARGDRRLSEVLVEFCKHSASLGSINRAYKDCMQRTENLPPYEWYANRIIPQNEILPWEMISYDLTKDDLIKEVERLKGACQISSGK